MGFFCRVYVDQEEIYAGDLTEVPEIYRKDMVDAFSDWAESLGKRGLNEMVYSLFTWYEKKSSYCAVCDTWDEEKETCPECGGKLEELFVYERHKSLDLLLTCVGMISRIEVSK